MSTNFKNKLFKILATTAWTCLGIAGIILLVAAVHKRDLRHCKGVEINIIASGNNFFINKEDVLNTITSFSGRAIEGTPIEKFDLSAMEGSLKKDIWIKNAELFFDNNEVLQVMVDEREPIARIFTLTEGSFYIDSSLMILPLSEKFSARVPVFTGFPSDVKVLSMPDSNLIRDIKNISLYIQKDSFLMAMIDQVDINAQRAFEMIPKVGNQIIYFGDAGNIQGKFRKLQLFYSKIMKQYGWNRYSIINLQYDGQVVAKIKGADDKSSDSLRTLSLMQALAENAARAAGDSVQNVIPENDRNTNDLGIIQQSIQREEVSEPFTGVIERNQLKGTEKEESLYYLSPGIKNEGKNNNGKGVQAGAKKPNIKGPTTKDHKTIKATYKKNSKQ